jgi:hypothetical protein
MKTVRLLVAFLFISVACLAQAPRFDIKFSEPLAIFIYVEHLSSKHPDNPFKKQFSNSVYNREKYKNLLAQFDTLRLNYTYDFDEFPYGSKMPGMTEALLKKNLISSANLKEFKKRSIGLIPNSNLLQLSAILYEFQLVYRELVYQPNKTKFEKQLNEITEFIKNKNVALFFDKALFFYKSYWDESFPFEIAFYPLPNFQGFSAEAFCNNAISALQTDSKDFNALMGIMFHEIFHILYDEQPQNVKGNISKWFSSNSSKCSTYSYLLLNEALATALGNGYVYETLSGKKDEADWYDRKYIDQMAKKIYPTVNEYITHKKGIDEAFINGYIKLYEENFTGWLNEMNNLMCYRYVISDNSSDFALLRRNYPYASLSQYEDQVTDNSIEKLKACSVTKMIIVSKENETKLALIKKKFPELKNWKYKAKQDFLYSVFLEDKTQLIILNTVKNSTEQMLNGLVMLPQADPSVK